MLHAWHKTISIPSPSFTPNIEWEIEYEQKIKDYSINRVIFYFVFLIIFSLHFWSKLWSGDESALSNNDHLLLKIFSMTSL